MVQPDDPSPDIGGALRKVLDARDRDDAEGLQVAADNLGTVAQARLEWLVRHPHPVPDSPTSLMNHSLAELCVEFADILQHPGDDLATGQQRMDQVISEIVAIQRAYRSGQN